MFGFILRAWTPQGKDGGVESFLTKWLAEADFKLVLDYDSKAQFGFLDLLTQSQCSTYSGWWPAQIQFGKAQSCMVHSVVPVLEKGLAAPVVRAQLMYRFADIMDQYQPIAEMQQQYLCYSICADIKTDFSGQKKCLDQ